jgi:polar amino acid transport system substrate-binding protein
MGSMLLRRLASIGIACLAALPAAASDSVFVPQFFDLRDRVTEPERGSISLIRFLTDDDFPPLNMRRPDGELAGFNIELARLICEELKVACTIQPRRWDTLADALGKEQSADAIIAAQAVNARARERFDFSRIYLRLPARFVALKSDAAMTITANALSSKKIGVLQRSAHEAFLRDVFPMAQRVAFEDLAAARKALQDKSIDLLFADGLSNSVWLGGPQGACCLFVGGPYLESRYFGEGIAIAFRKGAESANLRKAVDYGLSRLAATGKLGDLYLKYFPVGFF